MPKTILLIENDAPFAAVISGALEAVGFRVRVTGDGKDGLELARDLRPDGIVLCVELPRLSGYSICNKLKKDEALKAIPLVLTSSEATEEVFEDHRKLKVRAEDYLIKPFEPAPLIAKLAALIGLPAGGATREVPGETAPAIVTEGPDEEVVSLEDEIGLEPFGSEPGDELPTLDLDSLPDEPAATPIGSGNLDDDLKLLDDAFDGLSLPQDPPGSPAPTPVQAQHGSPPDADVQAAEEAIEKALGVDQPVTSEDLEAASASLPEEEEDASARADLVGLDDEADRALESLGDAPTPSEPSVFDVLDPLGAGDETPMVAPAVASPPGVALDLASGAGAAGTDPGVGVGDLARLETELAERAAALGARELAIRDLSSRLDAAESALGEKEAEEASLKARAEALSAQVRRTEADARAAREEAGLAKEQARAALARAESAEARTTGSEARAAAAEGRCAAAEQEAASQRRSAEQAVLALTAKAAELVAAQVSAARLVDVERDVGRLESELTVARGEVEGARSELELRSAELTRRISELEAANVKNEERVVKAYLKIKGDEKLRDKARKALAIALQLLEEGLPAELPAEKRPRPVSE